MDRKNVIGFVLLGILIIGFFIMQTRTANEQRIAEAIKKHTEDSIAQVKKLREDSIALANQKLDTVNKAGQTTDQPILSPAQFSSIKDSAQLAELEKEYGSIMSAFNGTETFHTLENDQLKIIFSNKGGRIVKAELKQFKDHKGGTLDLVDGKENQFNFSFYAAGDKLIKTSELFFTPVPSADGKSITFKVDAGEGRILEQIYSFTSTEYLVDYNLKMTGFDRYIPANRRNIQLVWQNDMQEQEKNINYERQYSKLYYSYSNGDVDYKNTNGEIKFSSPVKWVSCQQQFFNTTLIAKNNFENSGKINIFSDEDTTRYVKRCNAELNIAFNNSAAFEFPMQWYLAPNAYKPIKALDLGLETIIPTGSGIIGWLNEKLIMPLFHGLSNVVSNYGLVILLMTLIIKLALTPLTYRSYLSMAKMRVLNPEVAEIREKYKDDQAKLGQEQLKLFRKAGVSPLGGCLPTLLSMPILIAMFRLFPGSIELRQESFLWAKDLSTYDDILHWGVNIPFIGQHLSIFCVLMTISSIMYIRMNMQNSAQMVGPMKTIQYITPVFFLFFLNSSPAGLTYYYFVSNITTFGQQMLIRRFFINDDEIHRKIQENKAKPSKPKSGFSKRLEEAMKQSQAIREAKEKQQKKKK